MDDLDVYEENIIAILGKYGKLSGREIYDKILEGNPKVSRSIVMLKLMHLLELGYLDLTQGIDDEPTLFSIGK